MAGEAAAEKPASAGRLGADANCNICKHVSIMKTSYKYVCPKKPLDWVELLFLLGKSSLSPLSTT
jgi:hypothetical protein